jgi:hypothetical protein
MSTPTEQQSAQGWSNLSKMPADGQDCEIIGSDFMGEWKSRATFRIVRPAGPKYRWLGTGFVGMKPKVLQNSDVELWRPWPTPSTAPAADGEGGK